MIISLSLGSAGTRAAKVVVRLAILIAGWDEGEPTALELRPHDRGLEKDLRRKRCVRIFGSPAHPCAKLHSGTFNPYTQRMARTDSFDWDDLRYFLRAAETSSLSGASRAMGVEHTTIGRRLTALERSLGAPLVVRGPEGLRLTLLGSQVAPLAEEVERGIAAISDLVAFQKTRVRLATPSGFAQLLSESLVQLRADHPGISLEIVGGARSADLKRGEAHLALRIGPIDDQDLVARKLCEAGFSLYASEAYLARRPTPADVDDLSGHEVIGFDPIFAASPAGRWIEGHAAGTQIVMRIREMTDVLSAAREGIGVAMLPCVLGDEEPSLRRLTPRVLASSPLSLVYSREARMSEPVRAVIGFVTTVIRKHARRFRGVRHS
jgi:DNA-binding transcriptional LysR family regulator